MSDRFPIDGWATWAIGDDVTDSTILEQAQQQAAVCVSGAITRQVDTPSELHGYCEQLWHAERLASLGMLSATLTHELTQPLTVVKLAIQTALARSRTADCPEAVKQDLQAGLAASVEITTIISQFRGYAKQSNRAKETQVNIARVAEWTIRLLEYSAQQAGITLQVEHLDALPTIRMRENELEQVFFALVQNAVQAANGNSDHHLQILGSLRDREIELQFQDDCGGIEPANLPQLFKPFFTTKPPGKGTGLGLCAVHRIVQQRGGRVSVQNRYGQGVTFRVTLPVN